MANEPTTAVINELKKKLEENSESLVFAPLADAYRKQGKLDEALSVCKSGLEKHPHYASARVVLGRIYMEQGKTEEASREFALVLENDPENFTAHTLIGDLCMQKKDFQAAIEEYQKVLTLNPDDETVPILLKEAIEKAAGENKGSALRTTRTSPVPEKKVAPKESTASLTLASLYFKQGHLDKAIDVYQELLAGDPQNQILRQKLADAVEKLEEISKAAGKIPKRDNRDNFTKPPDQKEDSLAESPGVDLGQKTSARFSAPGQTAPFKVRSAKTGDDFKFTSEDILQVMQGGGKDDVVVEEKGVPKPIETSSPVPLPLATPPIPPPASVAAPVSSSDKEPAPVEKRPVTPLTEEQVASVKSVLAELSATEGISGSLLTYENGEPAVTVGDLGGDAKALGQLSSGIFEDTQKSSDRLNQGRLQQVMITAESGHVILVNSSWGHLVVIANDKIKLGLLRLALDPAVKKLEKIF